MLKKCIGIVFVGLFVLMPFTSRASGLEAFSGALESLADMTRSADRARESLEDAMSGGRDYSRYDSDWRSQESRLERERIRVMAQIAGVSESRIRSLRDSGYGWDRIAKKYDVDPRRFGYGSSRYDSERDKWKGVPPGLAKKGGLPPGQAKKINGSDRKNKHNK